MLHELLKGIKYLSKEHDCKTRFIEHTSSFKRYLQQEYSNEIAVFPSRKYLVHPININTCTYSVATLHDCGLRDTDLTKAFGRMFLEKTTGEAKRWYYLATESRRTSLQSTYWTFTRDIQCNLSFHLKNCTY